MAIYPDDERVKELRLQDPHGRRSAGDLERAATLEALASAVSGIEDEKLRDILETIVEFL